MENLILKFHQNHHQQLNLNMLQKKLTFHIWICKFIGNKKVPQNFHFVICFWKRWMYFSVKIVSLVSKICLLKCQQRKESKISICKKAPILICKLHYIKAFLKVWEEHSAALFNFVIYFKTLVLEDQKRSFFFLSKIFLVEKQELTGADDPWIFAETVSNFCPNPATSNICLQINWWDCHIFEIGNTY